MKNILSYQPGTIFSGKEILDWAYFQVNNATSHQKQGKRIIRLYADTLQSDRNYYVCSSYETFGCGNWRNEPLIIKVKNGHVG